MSLQVTYELTPYICNACGYCYALPAGRERLNYGCPQCIKRRLDDTVEARDRMYERLATMERSRNALRRLAEKRQRIIGDLVTQPLAVGPFLVQQKKEKP
jgi:predicted  nucleic acid-binding Zn-ribbon protein